MTGSTAVHDSIVWGDSPEEQANRRAAGTPKLSKEVTSELGCVTPVIVVPGTWTDGDLQYQAENIATMVAHSASCTCTSAKLLVTWRGWPQRNALLERIASVLAAHPARLAYYPGAARRYQMFVGSHAQARVLGSAPGQMLACATIYDADAADAGDVVYREEAWSPVLVECQLDSSTAEGFIDTAVRFCNERVFGSLSIDVIVHPSTYAALRGDIDRAIAALRYGTVSINHWSAVSFGLGVAPWGAYPGHTLQDVVSGIGFVHNALMFTRPLKSILWGPFRTWPKPPWFTTHRRAHVIGRRMAAFEAAPSLFRLPRIAAAATRP
jgi:hypothetical protein